MGYIRHTALVVTGYNYDDDGDYNKDRVGIDRVHEEAVRICGGLVTPLVPARANGYFTFMVAPHGSKLGWETQAQADAQRCELIDFLDQVQRTTLVDWVEVEFGGDGGPAVVNQEG